MDENKKFEEIANRGIKEYFEEKIKNL